MLASPKKKRKRVKGTRAETITHSVSELEAKENNYERERAREREIGFMRRKTRDVRWTYVDLCA